ncbi:antibiotic biosynthesis monooxygenase [Exilibacterium tricleocarpae]|uniref:Antibiotic biosynthesis monooxygenase n=1 Tax=Exilibacterium tricleocarpae TaxID=2591008 RepID=A0A545TFD7_9GAMM|nr:antibiotic biosynthesis monooxygenase [Exilibacterium tricleocarpae]TQV75942.1 antibiotic biosynthesis monooxygenase [Exilibacterium tricleocarpae]
MSQSNVGILATLKAKHEKVQEVEAFLKGAITLAEEESGTCTWFALKLGPSTFGIFDTFQNDEGRQQHLNGKIAVALMANAEELMLEAPDIKQIEILAAKI